MEVKVSGKTFAPDSYRAVALALFCRGGWNKEIIFHKSDGTTRDTCDYMTAKRFLCMPHEYTRVRRGNDWITVYPNGTLSTEVEEDYLKLLRIDVSKEVDKYFIAKLGRLMYEYNDPCIMVQLKDSSAKYIRPTELVGSEYADTADISIKGIFYGKYVECTHLASGETYINAYEHGTAADMIKEADSISIPYRVIFSIEQCGDTAYFSADGVSRTMLLKTMEANGWGSARGISVAHKIECADYAEREQCTLVDSISYSGDTDTLTVVKANGELKVIDDASRKTARDIDNYIGGSPWVCW